MVSRSSLRSQQGSQAERKLEMDTKKTLLKKKNAEGPKTMKSAPVAKKGFQMKSKISHQTFSRSIFRVLRQGHPKSGRISCNAMFIMNSFMIHTFHRIAKEARRLQKGRRSMTLDACDIQSATKLQIPGELGQHAMAEGIKAVIKSN